MAAPAFVRVRLWGALVAGLGRAAPAADVDARLARFAELAGLAIAGLPTDDALDAAAPLG